MPVESGNRAIKDGTLGAVMQRAAERWKPEAMYFTTFDGQRTAFMVLDLPEASGRPPFAEMFLAVIRSQSGQHSLDELAGIGEGDDGRAQRVDAFLDPDAHGYRARLGEQRVPMPIRAGTAAVGKIVGGQTVPQRHRYPGGIALRVPDRQRVLFADATISVNVPPMSVAITRSIYHLNVELPHSHAGVRSHSIWLMTGV